MISNNGGTSVPILDMPLDILKEYMGSTPKPEDFDLYWEEALEELRRVEPNVELIPADFQSPVAECYHLYFTGVRGARVHAKYLRPKGSNGPHPAILQFHGYSGNSGDWADKLTFTSLGASVAALDVRGQGGLSEDMGGVKGYTLQGHFIRGLDDEPENLLFRHIFLDTVQLAWIVMNFEEVDAQQVGVTGGSQGGALALACAALEPRIRKAAAVYPFLSDYKRVWDMDLAKDAYEELRIYFRRFDPLHQQENQVFTRLGYIDIQNLTSRIQAETLVAVGLMDSICPPSSQFAAINKMRVDPEVLIYPDFGHEGLPGINDKVYQFFGKGWV